ncbi:DUF5063 domain-containing protein [Bremerella sp. JC770]|uniref:DUF5063 domain-containing protein n=1 Tax=Bremerella sp. JC770 TaxID=3232137 RepID=UPI00345B403A
MSKSVDEFVVTASKFCDLVENHEREPFDRFIRELRQLLPLLYYQAVRLPEAGSRADTSYERNITHDQWQRMFGRLVQYLGDRNRYWVVHDIDVVAEEAPEGTLGSLSDDLADIWRDLKNGLMHWESADQRLRQELIWQWRFHFDGHWADHVIDALRAINRMCQDIEDSDD